MQSSLAEDEITLAENEGGRKPEPVQLQTPHDHTLVVAALSVRADELEKLAEKNEKSGYRREAKSIAADAGAIRHRIVPEFSRQIEVPLVTEENLRAAIANTILPLISGALKMAASGDKEDQEQLFADRTQRLGDELASRIEGFATEIAAYAYDCGFAARRDTPTTIAYRMVDVLRNGGE